MKKHGINLILVAAIAVSLAACAAMPKARLTDDGGGRGGAYVGAAAGIGRNSDFVSANDDGSLSGIQDDNSDTAWSVFAGYSFNEYFSIEAGYTDLGKTHFSAASDGSGDSWAAGDVATDFEADGWYGGVRGELPVSERWKLFMSLSWYRWQTTETFTESGFKSVDKNSGGDARYGAGVEYDVGEKDKWVMRAEVTQTEVDDDQDTANALTLGVSRRF